MPSVEITGPVELPDGSHQVIADVTDTPLAFDAETIEGRRLRYFDFGSDAPADAAEVVAAQLRAEMPVDEPATAPPPAAKQTIDL